MSSLILQPTPDVHDHLVIVGTTIRKPAAIVAAYLQGLSTQRPVPHTRLLYHFILDGCPPDTADLVRAFVAEHGGVVEAVDGATGDFRDDGGVTHEWTQPAMARVGQSKNRILRAAWDQHAEAVWFVDSDLLCDPGTFRSLWYADAPIACAVYWTRWQNTPECRPLPQVWLQHPYQLSGQGYADEAAFLARLATRQLTRVWGQGACTLIRRRALDKRITFDYVPGVSQEGMMGGEDRHFCLRADAAHLVMVADPWPHIFHIYHPQDVDDVGKWQEAFASDTVAAPAWLNLSIRLLEPVPVGPSQTTLLAPVSARFRVGRGEVLPELEEAALGHLDGTPFVTPLYYPLTYPIAWLRGQKRLVEVTVVDAKSAALQPNTVARDMTIYTTAQQGELHGD
jgi:hypothetical protein